MGRVGDGGGLRLKRERERETGEGVSAESPKKVTPQGREAPLQENTCSCSDQHGKGAVKPSPGVVGTTSNSLRALQGDRDSFEDVPISALNLKEENSTWI